MSDRQNAIRLLAADAHARGLSCFSNSLKIIADGYGKLEAELAALKEENERLKAEKNSIGAKLVGSRLAVGQLKARVAELEAMKPVYCVVSEYYDDRMNELYTHHDEPVPMADNFVLYRKEPANEG